MVCICISIGEINALLTLRSNSHSGCAKICFSAVDGCKDSFKCHILDFQLITKLIADGLGNISIDTNDIGSLFVLPRLELSVGCHGKRSVGTVHVCRGLIRMLADFITNVVAHDLIKSSVLFQLCQCSVELVS